MSEADGLAKQIVAGATKSSGRTIDSGEPALLDKVQAAGQYSIVRTDGGFIQGECGGCW